MQFHILKTLFYAIIASAFHFIFSNIFIQFSVIFWVQNYSSYFDYYHVIILLLRLD